MTTVSEHQVLEKYLRLLMPNKNPALHVGIFFQIREAYKRSNRPRGTTRHVVVKLKASLVIWNTKGWAIDAAARLRRTLGANHCEC